nr:MAG TPA: hypothetical protein [Caudoviricetes sp.]
MIFFIKIFPLYARMCFLWLLGCLAPEPRINKGFKGVSKG